MTTSIRRFLLINLLLSIVITSSLTAIGNYFLEHDDVQRHLDLQLAQSAYFFQTLMNSASPSQFPMIQKKLNEQPFVEDYYKEELASSLKDVLELQVWDQNGKLILSSFDAPKTAFSNGKPGFSDQTIGENQWRVYTSYDPQTGFTLMVAELYNIRDELEWRITWDNLYIILWTFPFLSILIWFTVGHGLSSLKRVADEIAERAHSNLGAVNATNVPIEIKPLVQELNKLFRRLHEAFERNRRFSADAAHELKTPLAVLKTYAQVALKAKTAEERNQALTNLIKGVDRNAHIVQQLLTLSSISSDEKISNLRKLNLGKVVNELMADLAIGAVEKEIELSFHAAKTPIWIFGNEPGLQILVRNLVDNAIRYTPTGGKIDVSVSIENDKALLRIIDTGPGIPPELRNRVFERFFRALGNQTSGSGLGLAIVQQIVELHNAEISLTTPLDGVGLEVNVLFNII